jgi:hypothetical protein
MMTSGKLQSKLIKYLNSNLMKDIKRVLRLADKEKIHSFSKAFKIKLDKKTNQESEELDNIFKTTGRMPARDFSFVLHGVKYRTVSDEGWKDQIKLLGKDHIFDTIYGYLTNIKSVGEWTLDEFKLLRDEYTNEKEKNLVKIKLYFTKYKENSK